MPSVCAADHVRQCGWGHAEIRSEHGAIVSHFMHTYSTEHQIYFTRYGKGLSDLQISFSLLCSIDDEGKFKPSDEILEASKKW